MSLRVAHREKVGMPPAVRTRPRALGLFQAHKDSMSEEPLLKEQTAKNTHTVTCHNTRGRSQAHRGEVQTLVHVRAQESQSRKLSGGAVCAQRI